MLGIVVALAWELKSLTPQTLEPGTCRRIDENITVALSGMGADRAHAAATLLVSQGARALLSWGCAAALHDRLTPGSVLLPESVIGPTGESHPVSLSWQRLVRDCLSPRFAVHTGALAESVGLMKTPGQKKALAKRTGAIAADMESAAQASFARAHELPFIAVRAIVDCASTGLPDNVLRALNGRGEIQAGGFLREVLLRPADWPALVKLGGEFRAARRTLRQTRAAVLDASVHYLEGISPDATPSCRG